VASSPPDQAPATVLGEHGVSLSLRSGLGLPLGDVVSGAKLSDNAWGIVPVTVDIGYRFTRHIHAGTYFQYGIELPANCPSGASCAGYDLRIGIQGAYHFSPDRNFDPWVGAGAGYERIYEKSASDGAGTESSSNSGFELLNLQLGGDFRVGSQAWLGPWAMFSVGEYVTNLHGSSAAFHDWFVFGLRGRYEL
jgi:hypothetical protein